MGLFTSKKIFVSSVVYNMAGPVEDRPDYLKTIVASKTLSRSYKTLGETLPKAYLNGPGIGQRKFHRWSQTNYSLGTIKALTIGGKPTYGMDFTPYLNVPSGSTAEVAAAFVELANFFYWAERHILETKPEVALDAWTCDYNSFTNAIVITYPDATTETITATGYDPKAYYVLVRYHEVTPNSDPTLPDTRVPKLYIYQVGSGTADLDALVTTTAAQPEFLPFIPLRIDNESIRSVKYTQTEPIFDDCKKAYRKINGVSQSINKLLDQIEDNAQIDDIDYCYLTYGVPLNTKDNSSKQYIYEFFKRLIPYQTWGVLDFTEWQDRLAAKADGVIEVPPVSSIQLTSDHSSVSSFNNHISWVLIDETLHTGLGKVDAEVGDIWLVKGTDIAFNTPRVGGKETAETTYDQNTLPKVEIFYQDSASGYRKLTIHGLIHSNHVYKGKAVWTTSSEAIADVDESGFIVPMHYPTLRELPLIDSTQIAMNNSMLVFNCYVEKKTKWYQSGLFKVIIMVVIIVLMVVFAPAGMAASAGVLGTNAAVGTALGFTGTAALIAGAVANALAGMILTTIITQGATMLFGERIGMIIGTIVSFMVMQGLSGADFSNLSINWGEMMKIDNLLKITDAVSQLGSAILHGETLEIQEEIGDISNEYKSQMDEIRQRTIELLGNSGAVIDPLMFLDAQDTSAFKAESSSAFLSRTLLTGSDLAEISNEMISGFPTLSLELPKYTS